MTHRPMPLFSHVFEARFEDHRDVVVVEAIVDDLAIATGSHEFL